MGFNIDLVDSNPHRNFDLYPIDKEQVGKLKASFKTSGDCGVLPKYLRTGGKALANGGVAGERRFVLVRKVMSGAWRARKAVPRWLCPTR